VASEMAKEIKVTLRRSTIGRKPEQRRTLTAMGLRRIGQSTLMPDNEATRGMIKKVEFMVDTEPASDAKQSE